MYIIDGSGNTSNDEIEADGDAAAMSRQSTPIAFKGTKFDSPVLITGLPRSGTSMVAGILGECGLWLGKTVVGGKENAKGFFENILLREKAQKAILSAAGFDPLGVRKLPPPIWHPAIPDFRSGISRLLAQQGYDGTRPWGFKDAKMTLTWSIWREHFARATWIIVRRPSKDVIASCLRTGFMNQHSSDPAYWRVFVKAYQDRLLELARAAPSHFEVDSSVIVGGEFGSIRQAATAAGLEWNEDSVRNFVSADLWHGSGAEPER